MQGKSLCVSIALISLACCAGCGEPKTPAKSNGVTITSKGAITVEDGKVTEGRPKVTPEVEREIYKALNYRRKMKASIESGSGSKQGAQQMQDELNTLTKMYMGRYTLTQAEVNEILKKGDANGWD